MGRELIFMLQGKNFIAGIGKKAKNMGKGTTDIRVESTIMGHTSMVKKQDMELRLWRMGTVIKDTSKMVCIMVKASTHGQMVHTTKGISSMTKPKEKERRPMLVWTSTKDSLRLVIDMVKASTHGQMVHTTKGISSMTNLME